MSKWEVLIEPRPAPHARHGLRRIGVPGGWLYQVENYVDVEDDKIAFVSWHPPVFVPHGAKSDGAA